MVDKHLAQDTVALLTPIPNGKVLAAVCGLNVIKAQVIETSAGSFAVLDDVAEGAADRAAQLVSSFVKDRPMLAMERRSGQVSIHQWQGGVKGKSVPPGLALDQAPGAITALMMGTKTIDEIAADDPDQVHQTPRGRMRSFWQLRGLAKQARRQQ